MNSSAFHLNLLKKSEVLSSSPVRIRIMLPVGALLACLGMTVWWLVIFGQSFIAKTQIKTIEDDLAAKKQAHAEVIAKQATVKELKLQLEQLDYYRGGVRRIGEPLAKLAEIMPLRVQITSLTLSRPPVQDLQPKGLKVPLFGPPTNVETQKLVIAGRTTKETPAYEALPAGRTRRSFDPRSSQPPFPSAASSSKREAFATSVKGTGTDVPAHAPNATDTVAATHAINFFIKG